ncbi:MAG: PAS domain S-box protein [Betaproteobacteria bacterium]|nr:PAS domain S-box protein [Betaproteobacteria bacterium]
MWSTSHASRGKMVEDFSLQGFLYDPYPAPFCLDDLDHRQGPPPGPGLLDRHCPHAPPERQTPGGNRRASISAAGLHASEGKYRELVHNANAVIVRLTPDGRIDYFNEVAEKVFGYGEAVEILGQPATGTIVPPREHDDGAISAS